MRYVGIILWQTDHLTVNIFSNAGNDCKSLRRGFVFISGCICPLLSLCWSGRQQLQVFIYCVGSTDSLSSTLLPSVNDVILKQCSTPLFLRRPVNFIRKAKIRSERFLRVCLKNCLKRDKEGCGFLIKNRFCHFLACPCKNDHHDAWMIWVIFY